MMRVARDADRDEKNYSDEQDVGQRSGVLRGQGSLAQKESLIGRCVEKRVPNSEQAEIGQGECGNGVA
jgi:hypothetical protein